VARTARIRRIALVREFLDALAQTRRRSERAPHKKTTPSRSGPGLGLKFPRGRFNVWTIVVQSPTGQELSRPTCAAGARHHRRAPDCTITIGALAVSRRHGRIELRGGVPTYFDEEDSTGSRVDARSRAAPRR